VGGNAVRWGLLAVRRQRSTELALDLQADDLAQKEQMAAAAAHDAAERRITDLYANAVEQLGSDKDAPCRRSDDRLRDHCGQPSRIEESSTIRGKLKHTGDDADTSPQRPPADATGSASSLGEAP
jgi:hypothetical protein